MCSFIYVPSPLSMGFLSSVYTSLSNATPPNATPPRAQCSNARQRLSIPCSFILRSSISLTAILYTTLLNHGLAQKTLGNQGEFRDAQPEFTVRKYMKSMHCV
jgi:hypothetical protein